MSDLVGTQIVGFLTHRLNNEDSAEVKSECSYALVICNHSPLAPGNSGDFDFWSSKSLLKAPPCRDCTAVFLCSLLSFHFTALFAYMVFSPHCRGTTLVKALLISTAIPFLPWGWGPWLQMTSALALNVSAFLYMLSFIHMLIEYVTVSGI